MIFAPLALAFALGGHATPPPVAAAPVPPMTPFEALDYLSTHRARLVPDRRLEKKLTRWALKSFGAAVMTPSLAFVPDMITDYQFRAIGLGPLHPGSANLYAFGLIGAIGAALAVSSAWDLATLAPELAKRARGPLRVPQLASLNRLLDLPDDERFAVLAADPASAARVVALAELLRANPRLNLSSI